MLLQLLNASSRSKPVLRLSDEKLFEEIESYCINLILVVSVLRPINLLVKHVLEYFLWGFVVEWQISGEKFVTYDSK